MSRVCWYVNLLIIMLPSTLYAKITAEIQEILYERYFEVRGREVNVYDIFELKAVDSPTFRTKDSVSYLIHGKDAHTAQGYLDHLSIGKDNKAIHHWVIMSLSIRPTMDHENRTVTLPVKDGSSSSAKSVQPYHEYKLTFTNAHDYHLFINTCTAGW